MNILLLGKSKSGKTRSIETLPKGVVIFSFDIEGYTSLRKKKIIPVKSIEEWLKTDQILKDDECLVVEYPVVSKIAQSQYVRMDKSLIDIFIKDANLLWSEETNKRGIYHVAIDSLTSFQFPVLEYVVAFSSRLSASQQDWGFAVGKMREIFSSIVANPYVDLVVTAHTTVEKDETSGKLEENLLVYGKQLPNIITSMFSEILLTDADTISGKTVYLWTVQPTGLLKAVGSRAFDDLPPKFPQDFAKLYGDRLRGGK